MAKRNDSADQRILTITHHPSYHPKKIPFIRLSGKWLEEAGFAPHTKVLLRVMKGCIVMTNLEGAVHFEETVNTVVVTQFKEKNP